MKETRFITLLLCISLTLSGAGKEVFSPRAFAAGPTFTHDLALGNHGDEISALQQFLIAGGFLKTLVPTGYFGPLTKIALGAWQVKAGIYPSAGFLGPISRAKINAIIEQAQMNSTQHSLETTTSTANSPQAGATTARNADGSPIRLKIPKLNIDAGFQYTGIKSDGSMEIPNNVTDVGWFTGSSRPGEKGTAVVTGHVAQIRGGVLTKQGVFSNLNTLRPGDEMYVINDKGETIHFVVRESRNYDPAADATDVFTSKDGGVHLNLITCEGTWNPAQLSYSQRLVIFAYATTQ